MLLLLKLSRYAHHTLMTGIFNGIHMHNASDMAASLSDRSVSTLFPSA